MTDREEENIEQEGTEESEFDNSILDIIDLPTDKDNLIQPPLAEDGFILKHPFTWLVVGKTGSGKTVFIRNLIERLYKDANGKPYFDLVFLFQGSPDHHLDMIVKNMNIPEENVFENPLEYEEKLKIIFNTQKQLINNLKNEGKDITDAPKLLIYLADTVSYTRFVKSNIMNHISIKNRHFSTSLVVDTQSFHQFPKASRLQAHGISYFNTGGLQETKAISENLSPPNINKKQFRNMVRFATKTPFSFLFVNNQQPFKTRYRKNLKTILRLTDEDEEEQTSEPNEEASFEPEGEEMDTEIELGAEEEDIDF